MIHRPTLPPLKGFVETTGGMYKEVSTGVVVSPEEALEKSKTSVENDLMAMSIDHELRLSLLEMGVM